jgi:hypothetical protein
MTVTVTRGIAAPQPSALPAGKTSCGTLTPDASVPAGYGVPYNVLSAAKEILIDAQCDRSTGGATINVGSGASGQYIYNKGYVYKNNKWNAFAYVAGTGGTITGTWITAKAKADLTSSQLTVGTTYVVGYVCQKDGSAWKCGCRDSACTTAAWQLQILNVPNATPSGTTAGTPECKAAFCDVCQPKRS